MKAQEKLEKLKQSAEYFFDLGIKVSRMITALDSGIAEEFILDLKRFENDYKRMRKKIQKEEKYMEKYNKNDDNWVVDYRFYPEQGYCRSWLTNKKENEYR